MVEFLRGDFVTSSLAYLLPYLGIVALLTVAPLIRLGNYSFVEKSLDFRLGLAAMAAHLIIVASLWSTKWYGGLLVYLVLLAIQWMLMPVIGVVQDWLTLKQLNDRDIARYRYMLTLDPNDANALIGLANAYLNRGMREEAIAAYEKAKAIDPLHTGVASSKLQGLVDSRVARNIGKAGMTVTSQNNKLLNLDEKVTMEYADKEDGPVIPEL
ncbi:MAG: tetratricopeptide repeat protein [Armatimonadota bacterium]